MLLTPTHATHNIYPLISQPFRTSCVPSFNLNLSVIPMSCGEVNSSVMKAA